MAAGQLRGVPVLIYHALTKAGLPDLPFRERKYWVTALEFREQLKHIQREKYELMNLQDWFSADKQASRSVSITFDDGRVSDYELAYPLLLEYGMTATFFVNTSTIGKAGNLSWSQARRMQEHGMYFQSHSREHVYLTRLSRSALDDQLRDSRAMLEDRLGRRVELLTPPYGRFNDRVIGAAHDAGYRAICTGDSWPTRPGAVRIDRAVVYRGTTARSFERMLSGDPMLYLGRAARTMALEIPKSLLLRFWPAPLLDTAGEAHS
jgi:peptidoglycan/xylan/chitin deacetylase (PgdA/CDA1 family)